MNPIPRMAASVALLSTTSSVQAESLHAKAMVGDVFEISRSYKTTQKASDGSSGSSNGRDTIVERVIAVRETGLELEYDLPSDATDEDRARQWQFPARIFRPTSGPMQLLNGEEMEERVERWLKSANWTRAACGRWIFTWNAFRIECDPQLAIKTLEEYDLRFPDLREGAPHREMEAIAPGTLAMKSAKSKGLTFTTVLEIDPEAVRRGRAESDVVVGEIMQEPVTLDAALRARAGESISGTISVTFDIDPVGNVRRKTKVTQLQTKRSDGRNENETITVTVERTAA